MLADPPHVVWYISVRRHASLAALIVRGRLIVEHSDEQGAPLPRPIQSIAGEAGRSVPRQKLPEHDGEAKSTGC